MIFETRNPIWHLQRSTHFIVYTFKNIISKSIYYCKVLKTNDLIYTLKSIYSNIYLRKYIFIFVKLVEKKNRI